MATTEQAQEMEFARRARQMAYQEVSDGIFFQWQRGEKTEQDWKDAVEAVNAKYPLPEIS